MGWSSKGSRFIFVVINLPTTRKRSSRNGKGPLPAVASGLPTSRRHVKRWFEGTGCRRTKAYPNL